MVASLPPDLERLVQRQVESGKYATAIEPQSLYIGSAER